MAKPSSKKSDSSANIGFEAKLWLAADKLRNNGALNKNTQICSKSNVKLQ